jgi:antitoxin FitA
MSTTLTIRNLDEGVKQKLRLQAASHQRSMEAEAREILAAALSSQENIPPPSSPEEMSERIKSVIGIWKDRMDGKTTDQIMRELRGDD